MKKYSIILLLFYSQISIGQETNIGDSTVVNAIKKRTAEIYNQKGKMRFLLTNTSLRKIQSKGAELTVYTLNSSVNRIVAKSITDNGLLATEWYFSNEELIHVYETFEYFEESAPPLQWRNFKGLAAYESRFYFENDRIKYQKHKGRKDIDANALAYTEYLDGNNIKKYVLNQLSKTSQKDKEWRSLFNGKDLNGWIPKIHHHEVGDNYAQTFRVMDGAIHVNYDDYTSFDTRYGHLFFKESFASYHLKFEYKFTDQWMEDAPSYTYRNSGIMFHSQAPNTILKEQDWPISVEYQMLADEGKGPRPTGNMCSPGTDVFFNNEKDKRHCISSSSKTYPWNEWVQGELIVHSDSLVIHKVNGKEVLRYTKPQIGGGVANRYNPNYKIDGKPLTSGYIGLQAEGQGIAFKNIWIKELGR